MRYIILLWKLQQPAQSMAWLEVMTGVPFSLRSPIATFSSITCVYLEVGGVVLLAFYILSLLAGRDMLRRSE